MPERRGPREIGSGGAAGTAGAAGAAGDSGDAQREALDALHARLLRGDVTAPAELAELVLLEPRPLLQGLRKRAGTLLQSAGRTVREDALNDAVVTAYMSYVKRPAQYDPRKAPGGLLPYLIMSAHGDLLNALPGIERHRHVAPLSLVELRAGERNTRLTPVGGSAAGRQTNPEDMLDERALAADLDAHLAAQAALMETEGERKVLRHMAAGERRTAVFADDLGITALPLDAQRREVKRIKDKIKKRLERAGRRGAANA